jgi:hypothetical protein
VDDKDAQPNDNDWVDVIVGDRGTTATYALALLFVIVLQVTHTDNNTSTFIIMVDGNNRILDLMVFYQLMGISNNK